MKKIYMTYLLAIFACLLFAKDINYSFNYLIISADKVKKYDYDFTGKNLNTFSEKILNAFKIKPTSSLIIDDYSTDKTLSVYNRINSFYQQIDKENYSLILVMGPWGKSNKDQLLITNSEDKLHYEYLMNLYEFLPAQNALMIVLYPSKNKPDFSEFMNKEGINHAGKHLIFIEADNEDAMDAIKSCQRIFEKIAKNGTNQSAFTITQYFINQASNEKMKIKAYQLSKANDYELSNTGVNNE